MKSTRVGQVQYINFAVNKIVNIIHENRSLRCNYIFRRKTDHTISVNCIGSNAPSDT